MDRFSNNVLDGMPLSQANFIRANEVRFVNANSRVIRHLLEETQKDGSKFFDAAAKVSDRLIAQGLERSKGAFCCLGTPEDRLAINGIARPLHKRLQKVAPDCPDLDDIAINLASIHAGIWTPAKALRSPAKGIFEKAEAGYISGFLKPLVSLAERRK